MSATITDEERVAVTEQFYTRTYRTMVASAGVLCAISVLEAYADNPHAIGPTVCVSVALALLMGAVGSERGYRLMRRMPYLTCAPALFVAVVVYSWSAVDVKALYIAISAPLVLVICVAQDRRQAARVLAVLTAALMIPAFSNSGPAVPHGPWAMIRLVILLFLCSGAVKFALHWNGLLVLTEACADEQEALTPLGIAAGPEVALPVLGLRRPPASALVLEAAHKVAAWMAAIRELIVNPAARRNAWHAATGFHARELQVLLLLHHHSDEDVADYLGLSVKTVRNTAHRALQRERASVVAPGAQRVTREMIAAELAAEYGSVAAIEQIADLVANAPD